MNDRPSGGERVVLVHIHFPAEKMKEDLEEFKELAISAGANIVAIVTGMRRVPESKYFVGTGKLEEIRQAVQLHQAELVLFNHVLSPAQERNLERSIQCRVLDRTGLILDIFAQRARSFEGKLQVELALLKHQLTRLVRGWTHLERQRGGIGLRGGPGETQLEVDRRLIRNKIKGITAEIKKIRRQREQNRHARQKAAIPTVVLVGYTNAGKSTLFNRITGAGVYVADQLFATLDPTFRRVELPEIGPIILVDTVGFIRHLPHYLVQAFYATLEEVTKADLHLIVVDASDEARDLQIEQVNQVLEEIGALNVPRVLVYNKIDLIDNTSPKITRDDQGVINRMFISATKDLGVHELIISLKELVNKDIIEKELVLEPSQGKLRAALYEHKGVVKEVIDEQGYYHLTIRLARILYEKFFKGEL